jgi:AcrR family transcriptional regulator
MVMRYFGNKEQLFAAAAEFDLRFSDLSDVPASELGEWLVAHFLARWEDDEALVMLLRSATTNADAAERMKASSPPSCCLRSASSLRTMRRGAGRLDRDQVIVMALCRFVLRHPPVVAMSSEELVPWLGPTLQRYALG